MKSLILVVLLLVPSTCFATGRCGVQNIQKFQSHVFPAPVQSFQVYSVPVLAQHQNFINSYGQIQQNVDYVAANQQNVKQKIRSKQVVQRQRQKRNLRERVQNMNVNYDVQQVQKVQKVQGNY